jgi:hypothetical protein
MKTLMSSSDILQRMEIAFWTISIRIMGNRKVFRLVVAAILLFVFLFIGVLVQSSVSFAKDKSGLINETEGENVLPSQIKAPTVIPGQSNLLIVLVDDFASKQPKLIGLWLAGRASSAPQIIFLPILPTVSSSDANAVAGAFDLDTDGGLAGKFLDFLRQKEIWWDHFLMADQNSLADLLILMDGLEWSGKDFTGPEMAALLIQAADQPQVALEMQAQIFSEICQAVPNWAEKADPEIVGKMFTTRFSSDLPLDSILSAREGILGPDGMPVCVFPTLASFSKSLSLD